MLSVPMAKKGALVPLKQFRHTIKSLNILVPLPRATCLQTSPDWLLAMGTIPYNLQPGLMTLGLGFVQGPQPQGLQEW